METLDSTTGLRERVAGWRREGERIGFVPTMGNLHEGHLQLVRRARELADRVVASIFVNPMQFGPHEDYDTYPRTLQADQVALEGEGVDLLFAPAVGVIYPAGIEATTRVTVPGVGEGLCADSRPHFFTGVATVVARLFNLVQPDLAVFGEKDYQQLAVIRKMVRDLCLPIEIEAVPTVREADGLAMSSRNRYLGPEQRRQAPQLYRTLCEVAGRLRSGERDFAALEARARRLLEEAGFRPDYVSIRAADTLQPPGGGDAALVVLAAAWLGKARLIDNVQV